MTLLEANRQAVARWGSRAVVHRETLLDDEGERTLCSVGRHGHDPHAWDALGQGSDFEAAFAQADARAQLHPQHGGAR